MQLVVRLVLRPPSPSLIFATIAAVPQPRVSIYTSVFPCSAALSESVYGDCSIVAARTRFRLPTPYLLLTSLIERRVRGAWRSKYAPRPGEGIRAPRAARAWLVMCEEEALQVEPTGRGRQGVRCPRSDQSRDNSQCLRCSRPRARQRCRASRLRLGRWSRPGQRSGRVCTASPHLTPPTQSSQASGIPRLERA